MNYIEKIRSDLAAKIEVEPDLLDLYTLVVLIKGAEATNENIHDAWAVWRNRNKPDHKSLIPFKELSTEVQDLDTEYTEAIKSTSTEHIPLK